MELNINIHHCLAIFSPFEAMNQLQIKKPKLFYPFSFIHKLVQTNDEIQPPFLLVIGIRYHTFSYLISVYALDDVKYC